MPFKAGRSGNPSGRPKGQPNKGTVAAREAFQFAFDKLGGWDKLATWAATDEKSLSEFYKLFARLIPTEITGKDAGPIQFQNMTDEENDRRLCELLSNKELMQSITLGVALGKTINKGGD